MRKIMRKTAVFIFTFCFTFPSLAVSDPYRLFGLLPDPSLSEEDIDRAFRRIKFRIHPDRHGNSPEAKERFQELQSAYENLKDPNFRASYAVYLRESDAKPPEEPNLYKILGVLSDSSPPDLTRAYRGIRGKIHPDLFGGDSLIANERLKEVQQAHKTLIEPALRAEHDRILKKAGNTLTHSPDKKESAQQTQGAASPFSQDLPKFNQWGSEAEDSALMDGLYEQIYDLVLELEKSGGEEDLKEAIDWYRVLVKEKSHPEAARRLAPLLEKFDMKEAFYRYEQAIALVNDPAFTRTVILRQAYIYYTGFSVPKDPEKAEALYRKAYLMGVSKETIAGQYESLENYEKAVEWLTSPPERLSADPGLSGSVSTGRLNGPGAPAHQPAPLRDNKIHRAIKSGDVYRKGDSWRGEGFIKQSVLEALDAGEDINALGADGLSPFSLAIRERVPVGFLVKLGADADVPNADGSFPIHVFLKMYSPGRKDQRYDPEYDERTYDAVFSPIVRETSDMIMSVRDKETNSLPLEIAVRGEYPSVSHADRTVSAILNKGGGDSLTRNEWMQIIRESDTRMERTLKYYVDFDIYEKISWLLKKKMRERFPPDEDPKGGKSQAQTRSNSRESGAGGIAGGEGPFTKFCRSLFGVSKG